MFTNEMKSQLQNLFSSLKGEVDIIFASSENNLEECQEVKSLLDEMNKLTSILIVKVLDEKKDEAEVKSKKIEFFPCLLMSPKGHSPLLEYYGAPSGHEFQTFIQAIISFSKNQSELDKDIIAKVKEIKDNVTLDVFVTPTWPYCPPMVITGFRFAMENPKIRVRAFDATSFPTLKTKYQIHGVPKTVINNGESFIEGNIPANEFIKKLLK